MVRFQSAVTPDGFLRLGRIFWSMRKNMLRAKLMFTYGETAAARGSKFRITGLALNLNIKKQFLNALNAARRKRQSVVSGSGSLFHVKLFALITANSWST